MQPRSRFWRQLIPHHGIYVTSFVILFTAGTLGGMALGRTILNQEIQPKKLTDSSMPAFKSDQYNILLIGVDDIKPTGAKLESMWLVISMADSSELTLIPIFPADSSEPDLSVIISSPSIEFTPGLTPKDSYLSALREKIWWDNYMIIDRLGFRIITKMLENAEIKQTGIGTILQDYEIQQKLEHLSAPLRTQVIQMLNLCDRYGKYPNQFAFEELSRILGSHLITDLDMKDAEQTNLENLQKTRRTGCELPTLNLTVP
jgi:hypothetical protein